MKTADSLFTNALLTDGRVVSLAVSNGRFSAITDAGDTPPPALQTADLGGLLTVPGFVEGHVHLDTSFYGDTWRPHQPCSNGFDVAERTAFQTENLAAAAPIEERARHQLELCLAQGSTSMRSHVMVDGSSGLRNLEAVMAVREDYRDLIDIQLVAFPQHGILKSPGAAAYMAEAMAKGCDLVGGLDPAGFDHNIEEHLDVVFGLAERHDAGIDIHLHDPGTLGAFELERIAERTRALDMGGRVSVSHAYCLGAIPADQVRVIADKLARAGVAIVTNAPGDAPFPPVHLLREAGVNYFGGNDNIRDSWWPWGDGDMLRRANLIGYGSGFKEDWELEAAFAMVTDEGARALGIADYGIEVGARADFVTLAAQHIPEAVVAVPAGRNVYKSGRLVASAGRVTAL